MNDEDIKKATKKLNSLEKEKAHLEVTKKRVIELERLDTVKEYIELTKVINKYSKLDFSKIDAKNFDEKKRKILIMQKNHFDSAKRQARILENIDEVKEYIRVKRVIEVYSKRDYSKESIINESYSSFAKTTKNSNNIMVFMGEILEGSRRYFEYRDLETIDTVFISESDNDEFKRNNKIIYIELKSKEENDEEFFRLRKKFFVNIHDFGQDDAVEKVVKGL